jgi:hypothetical protein
VLLSDQNSPNVQFKIVLSSVIVLIEVEWSPVRNVQNGSENDLSFGVEMNPVHRWIRLF